MATSPRLIQRFDGLVEMTIRTDPSVGWYRISGAHTLDACFSSSNTLFTVPAGGQYRSESIRKNKLGLTDGSYRGLTRMVFNLDDFWQAGGTYPHDSHTSFLTVTEIDKAGTIRAEGPIFVLPAANKLYSPRPALVVAGTAPDEAALATGIPPADSLHIVLPMFSDNVRIRNLDAAQDLLVSFGANQTEFTVPVEEAETFFDAALSEMFLHSDGATCAFELVFALVNGEMA